MADTRKLVWDIFAIDRASKTFDHIASRGEHMGGRIGKVAGMLTGALAGAATLGVGALAGAFGEGLKQAAEYEKITAQTGAVIKSTGGKAHVSAKQVEELAKKIESYSAFSDEAVQQGENLLLTFTNIQNKAGKGNDIFDQATTSLYDMAQALGEDPKKAAIQLGKALNDPVKGITALKRVGVSFSEGQKKVIDHLVKTGHTAKAQKIILAELNREFGGSAKAAGDTFSGSMTRIKNALMDVLRDAVTPMLGPLANLAEWLGPKLVGGLKFVTDGIHTFIDGFTNNTDDLIKQGTKWTDPFVNAGFAVRAAFNKLLPVIKDLWGWVQQKLLPAFEHYYQQVLPAMKGAIKSITDTLVKHKDIFVFLGTVLTTIILPIAGQVAKALLNVLGPAFKLVAGIVSKVVIPALKVMWTVWSTLIGAMVNGAAKAFGWIPGIGPKLKKAASDFNKFKADVNRALSGIKDKTVNLKVVASINGSKKLSNQAKAKALETIGFAGGTAYAPAGTAWVGENGPELMSFRGGERVYPHGQSMQMAGSGSGGVTINVTVNGAVDPISVGKQIEQVLVKLRRTNGGRALAFQ